MGFAKDKSGFVPSTPEDLKRYRKNGKKSVEKRKVGKHASKAGRGHGTALRGEDLRQAMIKEEPVHVFASNLFDAFVEVCKLKGKSAPQYREYLEPAKADGQFLYEVVSILSSCTWNELSALTYKGLTTHEGPLGLAAKTWTEAFHFARHVMLLAFKAVEKKGTLRMTDRSVLDDWPVSSRKRPSKEDKSMIEDDDIKRRNAAMQAMADDEDEDEDDEAEEDEAEDEDEDDEDEEPAPKKAKRGKAKVKAEADDESEDDDEDESEDDESEDDDSEDEDSDDDDEDDESDDEDSGKKAAKAGKGSRGAAKSKPAVKGKAKKAAVEDDAEDTDEDEDDAEESTPKKRGFAKGKKGSIKKSAKEDEVKKDKKGSKEEKVAKKGKVAKEKPAKKAKAPKLEDGTKITFLKKRPKGGAKTTLLKLVPKTGITYKKLVALAEKEDIDAKKVASWVPFLAKFGFLSY